MAVCANCGSDAVYHVEDPGANPLDFCSYHMPENLHQRVVAGHFDAPVDEPVAAGGRKK